MNQEFQVNQSQDLVGVTAENLAAAETADGVAGLSGRELDAAVAERVMGLPEVERVDGRFQFRNKQLAKEWGGKWSSPVAHYSTDIQAAMKVKAEMARRGYRLLCIEYSDGLTVKFAKHDIDHLPPQVTKWDFDKWAEAICLAALKTQDTNTAKREQPSRSS